MSNLHDVMDCGVDGICVVSALVGDVNNIERMKKELEYRARNSGKSVFAWHR